MQSKGSFWPPQYLCTMCDGRNDCQNHAASEDILIVRDRSSVVLEYSLAARTDGSASEALFMNKVIGLLDACVHPMAVCVQCGARAIAPGSIALATFLMLDGCMCHRAESRTLR
eukprot:TRINITY_DN33313_c0_g1_i1.p1 TRINITY_DN33313_c0_g1~~TRINITY_DN33313_c0_g1_i1.p1  ORF type:complete len:114 (+),score=5.37 TRINITY_DN33313_c0_g1_i1:232-573(+)